VDRLYKNQFVETGQLSFIDVSAQSSITYPGFSLGVNITDLNKDGWKDIYISNDFLSDDLIYINNQDGSFVESSKKLLKHSSFSAMGNDVVDLNNDGFDDILALDMLPEGNYRQKRLLGESNYNVYLNNERFGYSYQFVRNTLQRNNGIEGDFTPQYSDVSLHAGISATDWSWTPLVADFNHDGLRDVIITNGFPRDVTDHDFIDYKADAAGYASDEILLSQIPSIKLHNYAYQNLGDFTFEDRTLDWGFSKASYSNGAAYGDLDNDGDLDIVINNINDSIFLYQNNEQNIEKNYLQIKLIGPDNNRDALGTRIKLNVSKDDHTWIEYEHSVFRGYLSSHSKIAHFGLDTIQSIDAIEVIWPDRSITKMSDIAVNQTMTVNYNSGIKQPVSDGRDTDQWFSSSEVIARHIEEDYIDYNIQPLLPHKLSQFGPSMSVGDMDGDGVDDIYTGGSTFYKGYFMAPSLSDTVVADTLDESRKETEELGAVIYDFDNDGDNDMFLATESFEFEEGSDQLIDQILTNQNGKLISSPESLPAYHSNATNVKGSDYDRDGDLDLFVCGRVTTGSYPSKSSSYLLVNNSVRGAIKFTLSDQNEIFQDLGMVSDAIWTDYDNDGWTDLILVAELSAIMFYKNESGKLIADPHRISGANSGFWNSISGSDLDHDGDIDYILGNLGTNTYFDISQEYPYQIYVNDFDDNGDVDALPFAYYKDRDNSLNLFPTISRMDFAKEINAVRKMYPSYKEYAQADREIIISEETLNNTEIWTADYPHSAIMWNENSNFKLQALPSQAQYAPLYGTLSLDVNLDGYDDIIGVGNDYGSELVFGRRDALNGIVLINDQKGDFDVSPLSKSGFYVPDDGKSLVSIEINDQLCLISGSNKGAYRKHCLSHPYFIMDWPDAAVKAEISNGSEQWIIERYVGSGYLSQSADHIILAEDPESIKWMDTEGAEIALDLEN
jgi:ASPIC and UnbV./FG-GAP repeat.